MNSELNIADLLRQLRDDTATLVREEVALAKTEFNERLVKTSRNVGFIAVGTLIASSALLLALMAFCHLLADRFIQMGVAPGYAAFLGFLIVAAIVAAVSGGLITKAIKALRDESIIPQKTVQSLREDKQWAQDKMS